MLFAFVVSCGYFDGNVPPAARFSQQPEKWAIGDKGKIF